ncbi:hypothetical protein LguiA_007279 [Lonicera macranthoides]
MERGREYIYIIENFTVLPSQSCLSLLQRSRSPTRTFASNIAGREFDGYLSQSIHRSSSGR